MYGTKLVRSVMLATFVVTFGTFSLVTSSAQPPPGAAFNDAGSVVFAVTCTDCANACKATCPEGLVASYGCSGDGGTCNCDCVIKILGRN